MAVDVEAFRGRVPDLDRILGAVRVDERERVDVIVQQYRDRIRDATREVAMLSLRRRGHGQHRVSIELVDGSPDEVRLSIADDELGAQLTALRTTLADGRNCLAALEDIHQLLVDPALQEYLDIWPDAASRDVGRFLDAMIRRIDSASVVDYIIKYSRDPFGSYEPRQQSGVIRIYWQMIALSASRVGVSTEALTLKVLAHEYAHAFAHLGMDADGTNWDATAFLSADIFVHEGLANFWSSSVLAPSDDDWLIRRAGEALKAVWPKQPLPYHEFDRWKKMGATAEHVRQAVREARRAHEVGIDEFRTWLDQARG
jgi:hypothetical protein